MTAVQPTAATDPDGPTGKLATWVADLTLRRRTAERRRARQTPAARRHWLRPHRIATALVAGRHRRRPGSGEQGRRRGDRHRTVHQRARGGRAERHFHSGLRARRLPPDRTRAQLFAGDSRAAIDGRPHSRAPPPAPTSCSRRSPVSRSDHASATRCTAPRCSTAAGTRGRSSAPIRRQWHPASCAGCRRHSWRMRWAWPAPSRRG